jgi:hypothetical protein
VPVGNKGKQVIADRWIRGGCIAAAFFMAVTLFIGAEQVGAKAVTNVTRGHSQGIPKGYRAPPIIGFAIIVTG